MARKEIGLYYQVIHPRAALRGHDGPRTLPPGQRNHITTLVWSRRLEKLGGQRFVERYCLEPVFILETAEIPLSQIREAPVTVAIGELCPTLSRSL